MRWVSYLLVGILCACNGTPTSSNPETLTLGMPLHTAHEYLRRAQSEPTVVAMAPPQREDGSYFGLECFTLRDGTELVVTFDNHDRDLALVGMSVCTDRDLPKEETTWQRREQLELP